MSTWDPESEISKFNGWNSKVPFAVSDDFLNVVKKSITISRNTGGLFDPTVYLQQDNINPPFRVSFIKYL